MASFFQHVKRWFARSSSVRTFDAATFQRACEEDPTAALDSLRADQRELADELDGAFRAYRERLNRLVERLSELSPDEASKEIETLRGAQDALRLLLRRLGAADRSRRELEQELHEWGMRLDEAGPRHADHPVVRSAVIKAELEARNLIAAREERRELPLAAMGVTAADGEANEFEVSDDIPDGRISVEELLAAIEDERREIEGWQDVANPDEDAAFHVKRLRELHAHLKQMDREEGTRRHRVVLGPRERFG